MECNYTDPLIIEFNGLPGCGKSTICRQLKKKLEELGHDVCFSYRRKFTPRNQYWLFFNPKFWHVILSSARFSRFMDKRQSLSRLVFTPFFIRMYNDFISDRKNGILLADQGIVQSILSMAHTDSIPTSNNLNQLLTACEMGNIPIILINCQASLNVVNTRMIKRPNDYSRIGKLPKEGRLQSLKIQESNLSSILTCLTKMFPDIPQLYINTENSVENNVNDIITFIINRRTINNNAIYSLN